MKLAEISNSVRNVFKKVIEFLPKRDIEKLVFKILLGTWFIVIIVVVILRSVLGAQDNIEKKIMKAATVTKPSAKKTEIDTKAYETLLNQTKYPEAIENYTRHIKRDPFSEYKGIIVDTSTADVVEYDFVLKSINQLPLPMVYKGYIELEDRIIGQVNWCDETKFVEPGATLNGYKINSVSKTKLETTDENGERIEFEMNKPVLGEELEAILYDRVSKKNYNVQLASKIAGYKVVDITPNYVILLLKGEELKLER